MSEKEFKGNFGDSDEMEDFKDIGTEESVQPKNHRLFDRVPRTVELGEREIVFSEIGGVKKIFTKIAGRLFYADLTGV